MNDYQGIDTSFIVPTLVKVAQEQQHIITSLKALLVAKGVLTQEEADNV